MKARPVLLTLVVAAPVLLGALPLAAQPDPASDLDQVPAAVVNHDEPVRTKGPDGKKQIVAAGRQLAADLDANEGDSFDWQLTDAADARTGLRDGDYAAVVTIPDGFSETVSSASSTSPERARINVRSNDANSYLAGQIADSLATASAETLGDTVSQRYLETVYSGFNELHHQTGKAANGARDVANGADKLAEGATDAGNGADHLAAGTSQLRGGASDLADGTGRVADGAGTLSTKAGELAGGLGQLDERTADLPDQTAKLASGSADVASGADQLAGGTQDVADGNERLSEALDRLAASCTTAALPPYCEQVEKARQASHELADGAQQTADGADSLSSGAQRVADGSRQLAAAAPALRDGISRAADGSRALEGGTDELATGAHRAHDGAEQLTSATSRLESGARRLADGTDRLANGSTSLANGSSQLAGGLEDGAKSVPTYDERQREQSAETVSEPVTTTLDRANATGSLADSLAPVVLPIALWLGVLAVFAVLAPISRTALSSTASSLRIVVRGFGRAAALTVAQAVALVIAFAVSSIEVANPLAALAIAVLAAVSFTAVQQWLVTAFGRVGMLVGLAVLALQAATIGWLVFEGTPTATGGLTGLLPTSYAAEALRSPLLGGEIGIAWPAVAMLVALGAAGFGLTVHTVRKRRTWSLRAGVPVPAH